AARVETAVEPPIRIEPRDSSASFAADLHKITADDDLSIGLQSDGVHGATRMRRESLFGRSVDIEPRDSLERRAIEIRKSASNQNLAVGLHKHRTNLVVRATAGIESSVKGTGRSSALRRRSFIGASRLAFGTQA